LSWLSETDGTGTSRKFGGSLHRFVRDLKQRPEIRSNEISFERRRVNGPNAVHVCVGMRIVCAAVSEETARLFE